MKRLNRKFTITCSILAIMALYACSKDFLEVEPLGSIGEGALTNRSGVQGMLIGAYSLLDGNGAGVDDGMASIWNSWLGNVGADDARKGGGYTSQTERGEIEGKYYTSSNDILEARWRAHYAGVQRANETLRLLAKTDAGQFTEEERLQIVAEARFLRAFYHFEAAKTWRNIPWVDETISFQNNNFNVKNDVPVWPFLEEDFRFAADNLSNTKEQLGRAHKWAAKAMLAKTFMFQNKLAEAKPILDEIIASGVNAAGAKLDLMPEFAQNFQPIYENGVEAIFSCQMSVNDGTDGVNGNTGEAFNYPPWFNPSGWGHMPSFTLVNAYQTENGLPKLYNFNTNIKNDMGLDDQTSPWVPYAGTLDPRLDWTAGRRGIPFHDHGIQRQKYDVGGCYYQKKNVHWKKDEGGKTSQDNTGWQQKTGINMTIVRFADVLLWAAECEVEIGSLAQAEVYVNRVRARAANPAGFLKKYVDDANPAAGFTNVPAANYDVRLYAGQFATNGKDYARDAVRFERRLEMAMEGHRFFDLQRYDLAQPGYMAGILNPYMDHENQTNIDSTGVPYQIFQNATFIQGKHEIYAIPLEQIDWSTTADGPTLIQNPGHN